MVRKSESLLALALTVLAGSALLASAAMSSSESTPQAVRAEMRDVPTVAAPRAPRADRLPLPRFDADRPAPPVSITVEYRTQPGVSELFRMPIERVAER